jgi:putative hydrolase of the HAD superfamily
LAPSDAILLDALGTLVALAPPAPRLRSELRHRFGLEVSPAEAEEAIGAEITYYRGHFDEGRDRASVEALRRRCAGALREALPAASAIDTVALTEALVASLSFSPFADAVPSLQTLRARGTRLVVASNWDWSLHEVLARVGLEPLLDGIVTSAEAGERKPGRAVFDRALELAGVPPDRATHVGDTFEDDIAGARAAGLSAVLIRRDGRSGPAGVRTIASLSELV